MVLASQPNGWVGVGSAGESSPLRVRPARENLADENRGKYFGSEANKIDQVYEKPKKLNAKPPRHVDRWITILKSGATQIICPMENWVARTVSLRSR
jgi:hypothetical protein